LRTRGEKLVSEGKRKPGKKEKEKKSFRGEKKRREGGTISFHEKRRGGGGNSADSMKKSEKTLKESLCEKYLDFSHRGRRENVFPSVFS